MHHLFMYWLCTISAPCKIFMPNVFWAILNTWSTVSTHAINLFCIQVHQNLHCHAEAVDSRALDLLVLTCIAMPLDASCLIAGGLAWRSCTSFHDDGFSCQESYQTVWCPGLMCSSYYVITISSTYVVVYIIFCCADLSRHWVPSQDNGYEGGPGNGTCDGAGSHHGPATTDRWPRHLEQYWQQCRHWWVSRWCDV